MRGALQVMNKKLSLIIIAAFFVIWELAAQFHLIDTQFVPAVSTVLIKAFDLLKTGELLVHIATSLQRLFLGIVLALITALPLGFLLAGWMPRLSAFLNPLFTNFSAVNAFTLIPMFIVIFGIGEAGKVSIIYWVILWPALFSAIAGVNQIDPVMIKAARAMGAGSMKIFLSVILPGSINRVIVGIKSAITLGFTVLVGTEMIGSEAGIGWIVFNSQKNYDIPKLYVGILTIAVVGALVSVFIDKLQKSIIIWEDTTRITI